MIRIFIIDWIVESIKTYVNTPHDKLTDDMKSSFWAAVAVIFTTICTIIILGWFVKDVIDTMNEKRRQKIKNADLDDYTRLNNKPTINGVLLNNKKEDD